MQSRMNHKTHQATYKLFLMSLFSQLWFQLKSRVQACSFKEQADRPRKNYSCGPSHSALIKTALAARQVEQASKLALLAADPAQNLVKVAFSSVARGRNAASARET